MQMTEGAWAGVMSRGGMRMISCENPCGSERLSTIKSNQVSIRLSPFETFHSGQNQSQFSKGSRRGDFQNVVVVAPIPKICKNTPEDPR